MSEERTIHRRTLHQNFTVLPNELLQNPTMSYRARGVLCSMLSRPETWQTHLSFIEDNGAEGREAIRASIRELEAKGYVTYQTIRRPGGKFVAHEWCWYDEPVPESKRTNRTGWTPSDGLPYCGDDGKPSDGLPRDGFPAPIKNRENKEQREQRTEEVQPPTELFPESSSDPAPTIRGAPAGLIRHLWNTLVPSLAGIQGIAGERKRHLEARWKTLPDLDSWRELFAMVEASDFLTGRSASRLHPGWKASFDFVLDPTKFDRLREGAYNNRTTKHENDDLNKTSPILASVLAGAKRGNDHTSGGMGEETSSRQGEGGIAPTGDPAW